MAVASCVDIPWDVDAVLPLVALSPGVGAGISQANLNFDAAPEMARLLDLGSTATEVVAAVTDPGFDSDSDQRQHAVVTIEGEAVGFTGTKNSDVALDSQLTGVSAQGNILVSETVVAEALEAFSADATLPLAERLVAALYAGSHQGGDSRCGEQTALFASVAVAAATDDPAKPSTLITLTAEQGGNNPVAELAQRFGIEVDEAAAAENAASGSAGGLLPVVALAVVALLAATAGIAAIRRRKKLAG